MNNTGPHYYGFIDTCARLGIEKYAADKLYKTALGKNVAMGLGRYLIGKRKGAKNFYKFFGGANKAQKAAPSIVDMVEGSNGVFSQAAPRKLLSWNGLLGKTPLDQVKNHGRLADFARAYEGNIRGGSNIVKKLDSGLSLSRKEYKALMQARRNYGGQYLNSIRRPSTTAVVPYPRGNAVGPSMPRATANGARGPIDVTGRASPPPYANDVRTTAINDMAGSTPTAPRTPVPPATPPATPPAAPISTINAEAGAVPGGYDFANFIAQHPWMTLGGVGGAGFLLGRGTARNSER